MSRFSRTGMTKRERAEHITRRSNELAASGQYASWLSIEHALRAEGFDEARQQLDNRFVRAELDELCRRARAEQGGPI